MFSLDWLPAIPSGRGSHSVASLIHPLPSFTRAGPLTRGLISSALGELFSGSSSPWVSRSCAFRRVFSALRSLVAVVVVVVVVAVEVVVVVVVAPLVVVVAAAVGSSALAKPLMLLKL